MYKKIPLYLPDLDLSKIQGPYQEGYGAFFHSFNILDYNYVHDLVGQQIKFHIPPSNFSFTTVIFRGVPDAHTDASMTALNYYITSSQAITRFYQAVDPNLKTMVPQRLGVGVGMDQRTFSYRPDNLIEIDTFVANDHEAYLLNVHTIHKVTKSVHTPHRTMLRWLWYDVPFDQVLDSIEILG